MSTPGTHTHIVKTPGICGGRPRIDGHRLRVQDVAVEYELQGLTPEEICREHPGIRLAHSLKSTGPRTPDGKARVAQNAVKPGLLSKLEVRRDLASQPEWREHCRALFDDLRPCGSWIGFSWSVSR